MTISIRLNPAEDELIRSYANMHGMTVSEFMRQRAIEKIEDELDLELFKEAKENFKRNPKRYTLEEAEKAFNEAGKLPPEEELARQLAVSRITIRKALTDLEQEGLLLRIHGRGTFVNPAARQVKVNLSGMLEFGSVISGNGYRPECRRRQSRRSPTGSRTPGGGRRSRWPWPR